VKIRVLIVDDELPARELIATILQEIPEVEIVGECANGSEAVRAIEKFTPDLVFLDVQMSGMDGFEVLGRIKSKPLPLIIFVTAYNQHALRAFEVHALDYLLKPFEYDRLRLAVKRAREQLAHKADGDYQQRIATLIEDLEEKQQWDRLPIRENGRIIFLKPEEIDWIAAEGNYVRVHAGKEHYLLRETMAQAETRLAQKKFLRVNRSALVNLERVKECQPMFHGDAVIVLQNGLKLTLSRVYREKFESLVERIG
jgi:two-component system LytT family response regulator